jgi:hypothetical protein
VRGGIVDPVIRVENLVLFGAMFCEAEPLERRPAGRSQSGDTIMRKNVTRSMVLVLLGLGVGWLWGAGSMDWTALSESPVVAQEAEPGAALKKFMREKLTAAQRSLEGLCIEDYEAIADSAQKLVTMSRAAEWQVIPGPDYAQLSGEFRRAVDQLRKGAKAKDMDTCRLAYLKVTMGCLECHDFVRSTRLAAIPNLPVSTEVARLSDLGLNR